MPHVPGGPHRRTHSTQAHGQVPRGQPAWEDHAGEGHPPVSQPGHTGGARSQHPGVRPAPRATACAAAVLGGDRDGADHGGDGGGHGGRPGCAGGERRLGGDALGSGHHAGRELRLGPAGTDGGEARGKP